VSQQPPGGFDQLAQMLFPGAKDRTDPRFQAWIRQQSGLPPVEKKEETPGAPTTTTTLPPTVDGLPTEGQGGALYPMVAPGAPPTTTAPSTTTTTLPQLQRPMVRPVGPVAERPTVTTTPSTALAAPAAPGARPTPTTVPAARAGAPAPAAGAAATTGVPSTTTGGPATPAPAPPGSTQALKDSAARAQARPSTQLAYGSLQQAQQAIQTALTIGPRGPTLRLAPARPQPAIVQRQLGLESTAAQAARAALRAIQRHEFSPLTMSGKPIVNIPRVTGPIWGRTIPALAEVPEELFEPQDLFWQATNVYALITHARAGITALTGVRFTEAQIDFLSGLLPSITQREDVLGAHLTRLAYFYDTLVAQQAILANMTMDQRQTFTMNMYRDIMTRPAPGEGSGGTVSIDARPKAANE